MGLSRNDVTHWEEAWQKRKAAPTGFHKSLISVLRQNIDMKASTPILEIGAGSARDSIRLAELGAEVYALDFSPSALKLADQGASERNVEVRLTQANAFRLPFKDGAFKAVFSQGVLEHFHDPEPALQEQSRVLMPGGILLVDVPQKFNLYSLYKRYKIERGTWFAGWETSFSLKELEALFRICGFEVFDSYGDGYYPSLLLAIRNLHTFGLRHNLPAWLPSRMVERIEALWRRVERSRLYYQYMRSIGVLGKKPPENETEEYL